MTRLVRRGWRRLLRMSTALWLLAGLAVAAAIATFVPQEPVSPATVAQWRSDPEAGPGAILTSLLDAAGMFDVFGAWWFNTLLTLLLVSLTGCLTLRLRAYVRSLRRPPGTTPPATSDGTRIESRLPADVGLELAADVLRRHGFTVASGDRTVAGERAGWREGGSLAFHCSIYVLLAGAVIGHTQGFTGQVDLAEGRAFSETRVAYDVAEPGRAFGIGDHRGFRVQLDDFTLATHPDGSPADYVATVSVGPQDNSRVEHLRINHPLREDGVLVHLLRYGVAPEFVLRDADGREVFRDAVRLRGGGGGAWNGAAKVRLGDPEDGTQLAVDVAVLPADDAPGPLVVDPRAGTSAELPTDPLVVVDLYAGDLGLEVARPLADARATWQPSAITGRAQLREGETAPLGPDHTVELVAVGAWAGFQVSHTPGRLLLLAGATLMLAGLAVALVAYDRRIWVSWRRDALVVVGRSSQRHDVAADELDQVVEELRQALAAHDAPEPTSNRRQLTSRGRTP